jgi:hypothetical protein
MSKEVYSRIESKLDKQTDMLIAIKDEVNKEFSLLKLAHQKLKLGTMALTLMFVVKLSIDYPELAKFFKKII